MVAIAEIRSRQPWWKRAYDAFNWVLERYLPEGLYPRSMIILIAPMVVLQAIMVQALIDWHWRSVTGQLVQWLARDISMLIEFYDESDKSAASIARIERLADSKLALGLTIIRYARLPPEPAPSPFIGILDTKLDESMTSFVKRPFWIDTTGQDGFVDVRVQAAPDVVFRVLTRTKRTYAYKSPGFLTLMIGSSFVLLTIAVIFLRNQVKPILKLAAAAQAFGTGRSVNRFRPEGAAEVKAAALAFFAMQDRIERHVEQRTTMLAGVSHDLRTVLTRFRLQLALIGKGPKIRALEGDVDEMQRMLEGYMAFARGDRGERPQEIDIGSLLDEVRKDLARSGSTITVSCPRRLRVMLRADAFKRLIGNLAGNAVRFGKQVQISAEHDAGGLTVTVDDDGPGIAPEHYETVFKPFSRLDDSRNQDQSGNGLGLAIALDIARAHGGDIELSRSPLGGLRATVSVPA